MTKINYSHNEFLLAFMWKKHEDEREGAMETWMINELCGA